MRDRHSRTGLTKSEFERKGGAGAHNWGSLNDEERAEHEGRLDAQLETAMFEDGEAPADGDDKVDDLPEREAPAAPQRRMSQVSDQERADALRYREGGLKQNGVDLANIARTSHGIAQSPPANSVLGTSPLRQKSGFSAVSRASGSCDPVACQPAWLGAPPRLTAADTPAVSSIDSSAHRAQTTKHT